MYGYDEDNTCDNTGGLNNSVVIFIYRRSFEFSCMTSLYQPSINLRKSIISQIEYLHWLILTGFFINLCDVIQAL